MCVVNFLHHRAEQAGVVGKLARQHRPAKIDIAEEAVERVGMSAIGCAREEPLGHGAEMPGRRNAERLLAVEVVEERALGDAGCRAEAVDRRRLVAPGADLVQRRVEELRPGAGALDRAWRSRFPLGYRCLGHTDDIPTGWYVVKRR